MSLSENSTSTKGASGPEAVQGYYKRQPDSLLTQPLLSPPSPWESGEDMSCYDKCQPCCTPCQPCGPTPLANSCNEPCVRQCQNSCVVIQPSPVVVTLPGPILSSFPQNTVVGSSTSAAVGSILSCDGVPINSACCDLSCITSRYCGNRCQPC
ncbi:LOW QUALITY PROTEIN: feather keratin Cos2-3-like [Alca torda]